MRLCRRVNRQIGDVGAAFHCAMPCRNKSGEISRGPTGRENASAAGRHAHPFPEPVEDDNLELVRPGCDRPDSRKKIVPGCNPVAEHSGKCRAAWDVREKTRMRLARVVGKHAALQSRNQIVEIEAISRCAALEYLPELGPRQRSNDALPAKRIKMLGDDVGDSMAKPPHRFLIEVERRAGHVRSEIIVKSPRT